MNFIQNLGMAQRLIAAVVVMLILALLLLRKRGSDGAKASEPKTASAKRSKATANGDRRGRGRGSKAGSSGKKGRRKGRGKGDEDDADDAVPAVGRMVPRLPSPTGGQMDDPFTGAVGSLDASNGSQHGTVAGGTVAEPGWPGAEQAWPSDSDEAVAETDQTTGVIDAVDPLPAETDHTGWVEDDGEAFDPATGWGEDTSTKEPLPVAAEPAAEAHSEWTEDGADWTSDGATWETVDGDSQEESTWTTAEETTPQTEWTSSEIESDEPVAAWDPVEDEPLAEGETSFTDWDTDETSDESWAQMPSEPLVDEQSDFAWDTSEAVDDVIEAPVLATATMTEDLGTIGADETIADGFGDMGTNMPLVFDDVPMEGADLAPGSYESVADAPHTVLDIAAPVVTDDAFAAYDDAAQADAPTTATTAGDAVIDDIPMLAETTMSGFGPLDVQEMPSVQVDAAEPITMSMPDLASMPADAIEVHVAPAMESAAIVPETDFDAPALHELIPPVVETLHYEAPPSSVEIFLPPVEAPQPEAPQAVAEPVAPPVEAPQPEAPQAVAEPVAAPVEAPHTEAPSLGTVDALIHGPAVLRPPVVEPHAVEVEPVTSEVDDDEIHVPAVPSNVMSAPLRNPLDRWAHLTPSSDMSAPVTSPLRSWERLVPGQPAARFGADTLEPIESHVSAPSAPAEQPPATTWWDSPDDGQQTQRRGRFALGGYALCPGHQVVSGVTFRDCVNPPPVDWVIGPVSGPVPAGTLVLNVDGCMNCRVEDLVVLMEAGFAPTTDGFSLRLTGLQQGPFAASGTFVIH